MVIRIYKPNTPGTRNRGVLVFSEITKNKPEKSLIRVNFRKKGRNNRGIITIRHRGGGHKKRYRLVDFKRNKKGIPAQVQSIEYDPYRNARIALVVYEDGEKSYVLHPQTLKVGSVIMSGKKVEITVGNTLPLSSIPLGLDVHNIELVPNKGGQIVRAAGTVSYTHLTLPTSDLV